MRTVKAAARFGARQAWLALQADKFRDRSPARCPRLHVDVSVISKTDGQTGIQRVVRAVWSELRAAKHLPVEVVPIAATYRHGYRYASSDFLAAGGKARLGGTVHMRHGDRFLALDLAAHLLPAYEEQLRAWRAAGARSHIVIYDLLPMQRPEWFSPPAARNYRRWYDLVCRQADQVICISDQVARDFAQSQRGPQPRSARLRMAGDIPGSVPSTGIDRDTSAVLGRPSSRPFVLMVGTIEPRKGYDLALAAFESLWQTEPHSAPDLVIVGKPGWKTDDLQDRLLNHPEHGRRLFWLSAASDEALGLMYDHCAAVFLASHGEGFGLPGIEAAMHGRRALVRDLPVFREQGLSNLSYFRDDRPAPLAEKLRQLITDARVAPPQSRLLNWRECVEDLLEQMELRPAGSAARAAA